MSEFMASVMASMMGLAPGTVGGFCCVIVGYPIDLIKVRMQVGTTTSKQTTSRMAASATGQLVANNSTFGMLREIFLREGFFGLYTGVAAPLIAVTPGFAVSFYSFDLSGRAIREYRQLGPHELMTLPQTALAGGLSGIPMAAVLGPTERIKCLMQASEKGKYNGFSDCLQQVYREGGIRSVFKGTGSTALRDVPGNAAYFGAYELVKRLSCRLEGSEKASMFGTLIAGGFAGVANWIVALPMDTVKSRWQTAPSGKYHSLLDVLQTLIREEGPGALYRGLSPALLRAFPANAACFSGAEAVRGLLEER